MARKSVAPKKREEIIWALYELLSEKGHETVSVKQIADRAGMPHGVIHYYFKTKDEIIALLAQRLEEKYWSGLLSRLDGIEAHDERREKIIDYITDDIICNRPLNRVIYNLVQMAFEREDLALALKKMFRFYRSRVIEVFKLSVLPEKKSLALAAALTAVFEGLALQWMIDPEAIDREALREIVLVVGAAGGTDLKIRT